MNVIWLFNYAVDSVFAFLYFRRTTYALNRQRPWLKPLLLLTLFPLYYQGEDLPSPSAFARILVRALVYFSILWFSEGVPVRVSAYAALFWTGVYTILQNMMAGPYLRALFLEGAEIVPSPVWSQVLLCATSVAIRVVYFGSAALIVPFSGMVDADLPNILFATAICAVGAYTKMTGMDHVSEFVGSSSVFFVNYVLIHVILFLLIFIYEYSRRHILEAAGLQLQNTAAQALLESIRNRQCSEESIQTLRHDLKNHAITLHLLLEQGRTEEALGYLDTFRAQADSPAGTYCTGNELVDGLLRQKLSPALEEGVQVRVSLDFQEGGFLAPFDLCILLGNVLDNAVEACRKQDSGAGRLIEVRGGPSAGCLLIRVENTYGKGEMSLIGGVPATTKMQKAFHGFGLRSVKRVLEHYGGSLTITAREGSFVSTMLIPIPEGDC